VERIVWLAKAIKKNRKKLSALSIVFAIVLSFFMGYSVASNSNSSSTEVFTLSTGKYPTTTTYTVFEEDGTFKAKNAYGVIVYSETNALTLLQKLANNTESGIIFVSQGTYILSGTLKLTNSIVLRGEGNATVFKLANGANSDVIHVKAPCILEHFKVDGNRDQQTTTSPIYGVYVENSGSHSVIRDVTIVNCLGGGLIINADYVQVFGGYYTNNRDEDIEVSQGSYNVIVGAISVDSCTGGTRASFWIYNGSHNSYVGCISKNSNSSGFGVFLSGNYISSYNSFEACRAINATEDGFEFGKVFTGTVACVYNSVKDSYAVNCQGYGINIADSMFTNTTITGCILVNNSAGNINDLGTSTNQWGNVLG